LSVDNSIDEKSKGAKFDEDDELAFILKKI